MYLRNNNLDLNALFLSWIYKIEAARDFNRCKRFSAFFLETEIHTSKKNHPFLNFFVQK